MELEALKFIGAGMMAFGLFGAALGVGNVFSAFVQGIARNPAAQNKMTVPAYVGAAFAEALGLLAFVLAILMIG
jgi:F-type H+-transporting ATPase subunit c